MTEPQNEILHRMFSVAIEGQEGRMLEGLCVPYNVPARVQDPGGPPFDEVFVRGAFERQLGAAHRIPLVFEHRDGLSDRIGGAVELRETDAGLWGRFKATASVFADHALALVDDGMLAGFSIGFAPRGRQRVNEHGQVIRARCHLHHVALVPEMAYAGTEVAHRAKGRPDYELPTGPADDQLDRLRAIGLDLG